MLSTRLIRPFMVPRNNTIIRNISCSGILNQVTLPHSPSQIGTSENAVHRMKNKNQIVLNRRKTGDLEWKSSLMSYNKVKMDDNSRRRLKKKAVDLGQLIESERGTTSSNRFFRELKKLPKPIEVSVFRGVSKESLEVLIPKLAITARHSEVAELFLLNELDKLIELKEFETVHIIGNSFINDGRILTAKLPETTKDPQGKTFMTEEDQERYMALIVEIALRGTFIEFAYNFTMDHPSYFFSQMKVIDNLLTALVFKNPVHEEVQLDMAFKLREKFDAKFNDFQAGLILEKIPKNASGSLQKQISLDVFHNLKSQNADVFLNTAYKSILKDVQLNNPAGCAESWLRINHFHKSIGQHDMQIISQLLIIFNKNRKYRAIAEELIDEIPNNLYSHPLLVGPLLNIARELRRPDLANLVCADIKPPITRPLLSTLLKLHISFNDSEGSEKVLQEIYKTGSELTAADYNVIVSQLLRQNEFVKAMNIVKSIPVKVAASAYTTTINHIVDKAIKKKELISDINLALIDNLIKNVEQTGYRGTSFWDKLAAIYFKYLVSSKTSKDLLLSKQIYNNTFKDHLGKSYLENHTELKSKYDLVDIKYTTNPFMVENDEMKGKIYLKATDQPKIVISKTIADAAIKLKDGKMLNFAMGNLLESGLSRTELILDFSRKYSRAVAENGVNPRRARSYQLSPEDRLKDVEENDALNFLKNRGLFKSRTKSNNGNNNDHDDEFTK